MSLTRLWFCEIGRGGLPFDHEIILPPAAVVALDETLASYRDRGFRRPWISYLAVEESRAIGICGFVGPPLAGRVEIAYRTFPGCGSSGVAWAMAQHLIERARHADPTTVVMARTSPEFNATNAVLRRLGFLFAGPTSVPEDRRVWEWHLVPGD